MKNDRRAQKHRPVATAVKAGATAARPTTVPGASTCTCGGGSRAAQ